jgi:hypothetical protein
MLFLIVHDLCMELCYQNLETLKFLMHLKFYLLTMDLHILAHVFVFLSTLPQVHKNIWFLGWSSLVTLS